MGKSLMKKVFRVEDLQPYTIPSSGHTGWELVRMDNLVIQLLDNKEGIEFPAPGHREEEFIWVLEGQLEYKHGPVVKPGEAILIVPNLPHPGKYTGRLLIVWYIPETESVLSPDVMSKVIRPREVAPSQVIQSASGAVVKPLAVTDNISICMIEGNPEAEFTGTGHLQKEVVYVLQGQVEYDDGRVVRANEAICNLPNVPHPGRYGATGPIRLLEVKSPPDSRFPNRGVFVIE